MIFSNSLARRARHVLSLAVILLLLVWGLDSQGCRSPSVTNQTPSLTIAAVGDTNGYNILANGQDEYDPLQGIKSLLEEQDIFVFNFEGVTVSDDSPPEMCHATPGQSLFRSSTRIADFLHPTTLTIATLANNHILDCGSYGLQQTVQALKSRGILVTGAGDNSRAACEPVRLQVNGMGLALVSYLAIDPNPFAAGPESAGAASWEEDPAERTIAELADNGDTVIVALHLHLGQGWTDRIPPEHLALVRRIFDAGADIIVANGPHVCQGIMVSNGRVAFLSLGNFLFHPDYQMPDAAQQTIMAKINISPDRFTISLIPLVISDSGRPEIPVSKAASKILDHVAALSADLGTTVNVNGQIGYISVDRPTRN